MAFAGNRAAKAALIFAAAFLVAGAQDRTTNLEQRLLSSHNREREAIGVGPLTWDPRLAQGARDWANHLARTGAFEHSPSPPGAERIGENIWGGTPGAFTPESMVRLWIAEKNHFVPGTFPSNSSTGRVADVSHYTQLVWRRTGRVGCALSEGHAEEILVCRYSEAGNVRGSEPF